MDDGELIHIGGFAVLTGLSIPALRHYDEIGLLEPAVVDRVSGYRQYRLGQVRTGRLIRSLRAVDLPLDEVRAVLGADDDSSSRVLLAAHRERLSQRNRALAVALATLDDYIENGVPMTDTTSCRIVEINLGVDDVQAARKFYEAVFDVEFTEEQHDDGPKHLFAAFGSWPGDDFFLLNLSEKTTDPYRAGRANFGFLVGDLDDAYRRAIAAGGTGISAPAVVSGMPRTAAVADPGGNLINLYQNA